MIKLGLINKTIKFNGTENKSNNEDIKESNNNSENKLTDASPENYLAYSPLNQSEHAKINQGETKMTNTHRQEYIKLRDDFCKKFEPKVLKEGTTCWDFYTNSSDKTKAEYETAQTDLYDTLKDENLYNQFEKLSNHDLGDKHLNRQVHDIVRDMDEELHTGELKKELRDKENNIASKYNNYKYEIDGNVVSKADVTKILEEEKNPTLREKAYNTKVKGGDLIADDLVDLVKSRNKFAQSKGYKNFYEYNLQEAYNVNPKKLDNLLNEVYENAKEPLKIIQDKNKEKLANEFGINKSELKSYHYGLLTDDNPEKEVNKNIKSKEQVVDIAKKTYKNMGYDIDNMPITLDLFPRENKNTHGFCFDIDAGKDARILANLTNNAYSIDTMHHELGHCVYHLGINPNLSLLDKTASSAAMTEAVAMMMGDLQQKEDILKGVVPDKTIEKFKDSHKDSEAKFIGRSMLILNFEKNMYENPDQDLPKLWHGLKVKYTGSNPVEKPNNEWATIPHFLSHPAYYQNYFRASLMKAQIYKHLVNELGPISENKNTAEYLNKNIFECGKSIDEDDLIENVTGKPLSSKDFCDSLK